MTKHECHFEMDNYNLDTQKLTAYCNSCGKRKVIFVPKLKMMEIKLRTYTDNQYYDAVNKLINELLEEKNRT